MSWWLPSDPLAEGLNLDGPLRISDTANQVNGTPDVVGGYQEYRTLALRVYYD